MDLSLETLLLALHVQNAHIAAGNTYSIRQPRLSAAALWSKDQALRSDLCYVVPAKLLKGGQSFPPRHRPGDRWGGGRSTPPERRGGRAGSGCAGEKRHL